MMSNKDYELIAKALNEVLNRVEADWPRETEWGVVMCAELLAQRLHDDNPRFNEETFMAAVKA